MLYLVMILAIPLMIVVWNQQRCAGKMLCFFLDQAKFLKPKLLPADDDFVYDQQEGAAYYIFPERVRLTRFPAGWPIFLQQNIPTVLYETGNGEPLDWNDLSARVVSSKELGAAMEPKWLQNIVQGAREGVGESKWQRMMPMLTLAAVAICLLLLFVVMTKLP